MLTSLLTRSLYILDSLTFLCSDREVPIKVEDGDTPPGPEAIPGGGADLIPVPIPGLILVPISGPIPIPGLILVPISSPIPIPIPGLILVP